MKFINRTAELSFLDEKCRSGEGQLIVLWGKRRVGKTELVKQFIRMKPHIYFVAESTSSREQLKQLSAAFANFYHEPLLASRGFSDWGEMFLYLGGKKERLILVIDEFPHLLDADAAIASIFQKGWDEHLRESSVILILLGSSIGMMERQVLGQRSPLYGRRTGQWKVEPMSFLNVCQFRPDMPFSDQISHYAVAGGIPAYWLQFEKKLDFWQNIQQRVLAKGQYLYDEAEFILRQELREPRYYFAILAAISQGKRRLSELVNATGFSPMLINKYLGILADLQIVERELPATESKPHKAKKGLYRIQDAFLNFWFRFVLPRRSLLEMGQLDKVLADIRLEWSIYLGSVYETVCKEMLVDASSRFFPFLAIGRWWNKNEEIDLVAINEEENCILFAEVKYSTKPVGINIYEELLHKARSVVWGRPGRQERFALFSATGFTDAMLRLARDEEVALWKGDKRVL